MKLVNLRSIILETYLQDQSSFVEAINFDVQVQILIHRSGRFA